MLINVLTAIKIEIKIMKYSITMILFKRSTRCFKLLRLILKKIKNLFKMIIIIKFILQINSLKLKLPRWLIHSDNILIKWIEIKMVLFQFMKLQKLSKEQVEIGLLSNKLIMMLQILMEMVRFLLKSFLPNAQKDKRKLANPRFLNKTTFILLNKIMNLNLPLILMKKLYMIILETNISKINKQLKIFRNNKKEE